jgi:hypothetical protein
MMSLAGGCHCGYVQFRVDRDGLDDVANCHCSICRRSSGGTYMTWATIPRESLSWTAQPPASYRATPESERYFCPRCGAQLALYTELAPQTIDISVATLDKVDCFPPGKEIWVKSKIAWVGLSDALPHEDEEIL